MFPEPYLATEGENVDFKFHIEKGDSGIAHDPAAKRVKKTATTMDGIAPVVLKPPSNSRILKCKVKECNVDETAIFYRREWKRVS
jgi:hypothetical protein